MGRAPVIRVFVADDHPALRQGVRAILEGHEDVGVVGEAGDGSALVARVRDTGAHVLLLDISMPGPSFVTLLGELRESVPETAVIVLSMHVEDDYALRSLRLGAAGYVPKSSHPDEIVEAVRAAAEGRRYVTPSVAARLADTVGRGGMEGHDSLSRREFEVLRLAGSGARPGDIARRLDLSPKTVSTYLRRIREKLDLETRGEVIRYAVERGLLDRGFR